jgi:hypothetical protein
MGSQTFTSVQGSFPYVSPNTAEQDEGDSGNKNSYSLQLNTSHFATSACNGVMGCQGEMQFAYISSGAQDSNTIIVIENLLIGLTPCPSKWTTGEDGNCYYNNVGPDGDHGLPALTISDLAAGATLTGSLDSQNNDWYAVLCTAANDCWDVSNPDTILGLSGKWAQAEFNIFGEAMSSVANFGISSGVVNITVGANATYSDGTTTVPQCNASGGSFTGETNTLYLTRGSCCVQSVGSGVTAATFMESSNQNASFPGCMVSESVPIKLPLIF